MSLTLDPNSHPRRVAIVADEREWVEATASLLVGLGLVVVATETDPTRVAWWGEQLSPDLLAIHVPNGRSRRRVTLEALTAAHTRFPALRSIAFGDDTDAMVQEAFASGAAAYVTRRASVEDVASTVRQSFGQNVHFGLSSVSQPDRIAEETPLTPREREVLQIVLEGRTNAEAAKALFVTEQTIKYHLSNVYSKLNVSNRTQASRWAHEHGLLHRNIGTQNEATAKPTTGRAADR